MRRSVGAVLVSAALIGALAGCTGSSPAGHTSAAATTSAGASASEPAPASAEATVVAYYQRLGAHDAAGASALLEPGLRSQMLAAGPDGDLANITSVTNIRDVKAAKAPILPDVPHGYGDVTQVFLTFDVVYKHEVAAQNGPNSRFVYVARQGPRGPWRILEIGTGP